MLISRDENVPGYDKSDVEKDVPFPDRTDNGIKERLALRENDPNLRQADRNMTMAPLHGQASGYAISPVDTARRSTQ